MTPSIPVHPSHLEATPAGAFPTIQPHAAGTALGVVLGLFHAFWAALVAFGVAQPVLDFIFQLHMIVPPYQVGPFDAATAVGLVAFTSIIGYVGGWTAAHVWNRFGAQGR